MTAHRSHSDLYLAAAGPGGTKIADPGAAGTLDLKSRFWRYAEIHTTNPLAPAVRYLPDDVPPFVPVFVRATGTAGCLVEVRTRADVTVRYIEAGQVGEFLSVSDTEWVGSLKFSGREQGFIDLPLAGWREVTSNDVTNAAGNGGVLATDTTPALEYVNGDADSQIRLLWAATNQDAITRQLTLPPDCDTTQPLVLHITAISGGLNDSPVIDVDTFFNQGDTKVSDATEAIQDNVAGVTATIAAADIPANGGTVAGESGLPTMSIELTPGAHGSDTLAIFATWLTYTKRFTGV